MLPFITNFSKIFRAHGSDILRTPQEAPLAVSSTSSLDMILALTSLTKTRPVVFLTFRLLTPMSSMMRRAWWDNAHLYFIFVCFLRYQQSYGNQNFLGGTGRPDGVIDQSSHSGDGVFEALHHDHSGNPLLFPNTNTEGYLSADNLTPSMFSYPGNLDSSYPETHIPPEFVYFSPLNDSEYPLLGSDIPQPSGYEASYHPPQSHENRGTLRRWRTLVRCLPFKSSRLRAQYPSCWNAANKWRALFATWFIVWWNTSEGGESRYAP